MAVLDGCTLHLLAVRFAVLVSGVSRHGALHTLCSLRAAALRAILALAIFAAGVLLAALAVSALSDLLRAALLIFAAGHVFPAAGAGAWHALPIGATGIFTTWLALQTTVYGRALGVHGTLLVCGLSGRSGRLLCPKRRGCGQRDDQHERRK